MRIECFAYKDKHGMMTCEALSRDDFNRMFSQDKCGTKGCPFYKKHRSWKRLEDDVLTSNGEKYE